MSGVQPVAIYAMRVPPGNILVPAVPEFAAAFRLTMAAVDPDAAPVLGDKTNKQPARATLKVVRIPDEPFDEEESDDEDYLDIEDDDEDESSDEEANGGPSDKSRKQKLLEALAAAEDEDEEMEDDEEEDEDDELAAAALIKQLTKKNKGKGKAPAGEDDEEEDDFSDDEPPELDVVVLCTLDTAKHYNQPLDFVVGEGERVFFQVSGTHTVHLTGNYVIPADDAQASLYDEDDEDEDYDLSPGEDELDGLEDDEEESDELDDLADPRITEVQSDEEETTKLLNSKKGKNKRPANDSDAEEANLDDIMAKSIKKEEVVVNGDAKKLSKAEKKAAKKLKKNDGEAAPAATPPKKPETNGTSSEKKVQFAKNLEQGPTPSTTPPPIKREETKKEDTKKAGSKSVSLGVRNVNGVTVDDRKIGSGPQAKKNNKIEMRYIGKLEDGKVFDSNKSGSPFKFKLGVGEVIKGWDVGMEGISAGGERRITIPAHLAYGKKALPGIPKNSTLIFDVKCLSVK